MRALRAEMKVGDEDGTVAPEWSGGGEHLSAFWPRRLLRPESCKAFVTVLNRARGRIILVDCDNGFSSKNWGGSSQADRTRCVMSENETIETAEFAPATPEKRPKAKDRDKAKVKAKVVRVKGENRAKQAHDFDFIGKVESLRVKSGGGAEGFEFGLKGRHGKRKHFRFESADTFAMNAMAHLVLAAHANETKIGVRTGAEIDGVLIVRELEARPKIGKGG